MIKEIHTFDKYENFIRDISAIPSFADPHFQYNEGNLYDALNNENTKAFVVTNEGQMKGLFVWLILPGDRYIELIIGLSNAEDAVDEMLCHMEKHYPQYQMDFVINPGNTAFRKVLESRRAKFATEQIKLLCEKPAPSAINSEIILLNENYEEEYIAFHQKDVYWTADKILQAKDIFRVFLAVRNNKVVGYLDVTYTNEENEPYSLWVDDAYKNQGMEKDLLLSALIMNYPKRMMALVDINSYNEIKLYESVGFERIEGQNSLYASY